MKGTIVKCLAEMVTERFGKDKWEDALAGAGLGKDSKFMLTQDVDDGVIMKVIGSLCDTLDISFVQAADAFGDYWATVYAPRIYKPFYTSANSAKEFLLKMDAVHTAMTRDMPDARPPRFGYTWEDSNTLIMEYKSSRGLVDLAVGLAKGVGKYYQEDLAVTKVGDDRVRIVFPPE